MVGVAGAADRGHRPERFGVEGLHARLNPGQHGGCIERTRTIQLVPADQQLRTGVDRSTYLRVELLQQILARHRADAVRRVAAVANGQCLHLLAELRHETIVDRVFDDDALAGDADLPGVLEARGHRRIDGRIKIGIGQDDERIGTAQFQHHLLQRLPGLGSNAAAGGHTAGQGDRGDAVIGDRAAGALAADVGRDEGALRQAGIAPGGVEQLRGTDDVLGRLQQEAVAAHQDRHRRAHHLPVREVPRHDAQHHAQRQVGHVSLVVGHLGRFVAQELRTVVGVPVAQHSTLLDFGQRFGVDLAHFGGSQRGQLFTVTA